MGWEISQEALFPFAVIRKRQWLHWLSVTVYPSFLPESETTTQKLASFLEDLWQDHPKAARVQTAAAVTLCLLPLLLRPYSFKWFPSLSRDQKERFLSEIRSHHWYWVRLLFQALWSFAWVGALRESGQKRPAKSSRSLPKQSEYLVVGSGASGATHARELARRGHQVLILEEGQKYSSADFGKSLYQAMCHLFRDGGISAMRGRSVIALLQGRTAGGSTVINGAISHPLPEAVYREWARDPGIRESFSFDTLTKISNQLWKELRISARAEEIALPLKQALNELGWDYQAAARSAPDCLSSGRCLQGCPTGSKLSMEKLFLPQAIQHGAQLYPKVHVEEILWDGNHAKGVLVSTERGKIPVLANRGVVLAAGALESPAILMRSGLSLPSLGKHFRCHLSVSVSGLLPRPRLEIEGRPQRCEVFCEPSQGIKLASQLVPDEIMFSRLPVLGNAIRNYQSRTQNLTSWVATIASDAPGKIALDSRGRPWVTFEPSQNDLQKIRTGVERLGQLLFSLGAEMVFPPLTRGPFSWSSPQEMQSLNQIPRDPREFWITTTHLFGGCRMGSHPQTSVVSAEFKVHGTSGLYVVDASVFPSPLGVNPQHAILTMGHLATNYTAPTFL